MAVKAAEETSEELPRNGAAVVRRVDELFLDCGEDDGNDSGRRPYWHFGSDWHCTGARVIGGVAVQQRWNGMLK